MIWYFLCIFGAQPGMGDFIIFSYFRVRGVFVFCSTPRKIAKLGFLSASRFVRIAAIGVADPRSRCFVLDALCAQFKMF